MFDVSFFSDFIKPSIFEDIQEKPKFQVSLTHPCLKSILKRPRFLCDSLLHSKSRTFCEANVSKLFGKKTLSKYAHQSRKGRDETEKKIIFSTGCGSSMTMTIIVIMLYSNISV